jgi:hypothetical protein
MAIGWLSVASFAWQYVVPALKDCADVLMKGTYTYIKDRVDDADVKDLHGLEKRTLVFDGALEFLDEKGVDTSTVSSALIYLLIEIAVVNLKKQKNKLRKTKRPNRVKPKTR